MLLLVRPSERLMSSNKSACVTVPCGGDIMNGLTNGFHSQRCPRRQFSVNDMASKRIPYLTVGDETELAHTARS